MDKKNAGVLFAVVALIGAAQSAMPVQAQILQEDPTTVNVVPRVVEQKVHVESSNLVDESSLPKRSNYSKRLSDILEQITTAHERGWLNSNQYNDLKNWQASCAMEELVLRQNGNGIVARGDTEQLERHLNGLEYTVNREVSEGSRVANFGSNPM